MHNLDFLPHLSRCAAEAFRRVCEQNNITDRKGGWLAVFDTHQPHHPVAHILVGQWPDQAEQRHAYSLEKGRRLIARGGSSSFETRDPDQSHWGGAIQYNGLVFSFSGLPEHADEIMMILLMRLLPGVGIDWGVAGHIIAISGNTMQGRMDADPVPES